MSGDCENDYCGKNEKGVYICCPMNETRIDMDISLGVLHEYCNLRKPNGSFCSSKSNGDCANDVCAKNYNDEYICCPSGEYRFSL